MPCSHFTVCNHFISRSAAFITHSASSIVFKQIRPLVRPLVFKVRTFDCEHFLGSMTRRKSVPCSTLVTRSSGFKGPKESPKGYFLDLIIQSGLNCTGSTNKIGSSHTPVINYLHPHFPLTLISLQSSSAEASVNPPLPSIKEDVAPQVRSKTRGGRVH